MRWPILQQISAIKMRPTRASKLQMVGAEEFESPTSSTSKKRSSQLSYAPKFNLFTLSQNIV